MLNAKQLPVLIWCLLDYPAFFPSMHSSHVNPQKHQLQRESCSFFMQARFLLLLSCYVCDIYISTVTLSLILKQ